MTLGLVAGSFPATLTVRWSCGETLAGHSACDHCQQQLRAAELVPLLSFLITPLRWRHRLGASSDRTRLRDR
jgi:leader peptidase (prepilin peptidase)/N-methyltransferase